MSITRKSQVILGELLHQVSRPIRVAPDDLYRSLGVKWYAKGLFLKESTRGSEIKATRLFVVEDGDFIYNRLFAWKGSFALAGPEHAGCVVSNEFPTFRVKTQRLLPKYLMAFCANPWLWDMIAGQSSGTAEVSRLRLKEAEFLRLGIPLPPLAKQERIVTLLDEADTLRKLRVKADERMATLTSALFYEMFGDPESNPHGWPVKRAGDLMAACGYGTSQKANEEGRGVPVLRMGNVTTDGRLNLDDLKTVELMEGELAKQRLQAGDVLFNRTNSRELVGKTGMWDGRFEAVPASYFIRIRFRADAEHPQHFTTFMNLPSMKRRLLEMARGAVGQANINSKELQAIDLPIPPLSLQNDFAARVGEIRLLEAGQGASRRRLEDLFQSTLDRAFKGEI